MGKYNEALSYAASLCSASEQCAADILRKTEKFELSTAEKGMLVRTLKQDGFLDGDRFVRAFIGDRFKFSKWGKIKIVYMLKQKGFDTTIIKNGLEMIDQDEYEKTLLELLKQKRRSTRSNSLTDLKGRLYRFAMSRGFESSVTGMCLKRMNLGKDEGESTEY